MMRTDRMKSTEPKDEEKESYKNLEIALDHLQDVIESKLREKPECVRAQAHYTIMCWKDVKRILGKK